MPRDSASVEPQTLEEAGQILARWRVRDGERAWLNLNRLRGRIDADAWRKLWPLLVRGLAASPDADMTLNNLERLLAGAANTAVLGALLDGRTRAFETVVQLLGTSQSFSDLLVVHPEDLEMIRVPARKTPGPADLANLLRAEVASAADDGAVLRAFRRFRQRQTLRIGTNDVIRERPLEEITRDISRVADAALEVAFETAMRQAQSRFGEARIESGAAARMTVFAFGKLGGEELNYSSDIDLMAIYDEEGASHGGKKSISNEEFFGRIVTEMVRLLSARTDDGQAYRVDLRLRPEGQRGVLTRSLASTLQYYDSFGRTWERQALIKLRPVAGDELLGRRFMEAIEPYVYRRYLSFTEINEIKVLKRRIEQKTGRAGEGDTDVKTGLGGIRDIEFTTQFLQLLNGGDIALLRRRGTLEALVALAEAGCLTDQEFLILDDGYRYLRKLEHRLQLLFDLQTHVLPTGNEELTQLARRMGYRVNPLAVLLEDYRAKTMLNRKILEHLLHQTFQSESGEAEPESDLVLDPNPDPETIRAVMARYPFRDPLLAYQHLVQLATESVPFLSARRCRHFLASIAGRLLRALAATPDPDQALVILEKVSASVGAKAVLWELFSFNPPSLKLYVDLCAYSPFLSDILIHNPGMIDELLDSLVLNQPKALGELEAELTELCRGAGDIQPILRSFQDQELLRIGVRDILGKDSIEKTTRALSDVAEAILQRIAEFEATKLQARFGSPGPGPDGRPCGYTIMGLGKLGGQELGYHSDLDLMLVYECDGYTQATGQAEATDHFHLFTELAQRIIRAAGAWGPFGRLYVVDMRLRPTGRSGSLVIPLDEFQRYYAERQAQLWERQALTRARMIAGDPALGGKVEAAVREAVYGLAWRNSYADEIQAMRDRLEASRGERDLKRGFGGIADVEFIVQLLQMKYGGEKPSLRQPNIWAALDALARESVLYAGDARELASAYDFLRLVESRLRLFHNRSLDEIPHDAEDLNKLAKRLGFDGAGAGDRFLAELERVTSRTRQLFIRLVDQEKM